ncbi:MAG TPA: neutral zinc metallopeptidase [Thermoanaerobaculia bacterium]
MRWQQGRRSTNVEDRRGMGPMLLGGGGIGAVIIAVLFVLLGGDPNAVIPTEQPAASTTAPANDEMSQFVSAVLADTEDTWRQLYPRNFGGDYTEPRLVLFTGAAQSACGFAQAAMGPFYCPLDQKVYIDLSFYEDLRNRFSAEGDFAQAYVIAHEVGHHVQTLAGISQEVHDLRARTGGRQANELSVRQELQADCFAGVWANHADRTRAMLEPGDLDEALNAASAIGDDRLQRSQQGYVTPDSFTHGSSAQRVEWFQRGFRSGDVKSCNTFETSSL